MNESSRQITTAAVISYVTIAINIIAGLIYTPWMIDQIGKSHYGLYTLAMSIIALFTFDFGLGEAITRYVSKFVVEGDKRKEAIFLNSIFKFFGYVSIAIFVIFMGVYFLADKIYVELTPQELHSFKQVFIIAALFAVVSFPFKPVDGILFARERFIFLKSAVLIHRLLTIGSTILVLVLGFDLMGLIIVNAATGLLLVIIKLVYGFKHKIINYRTKEKDKELMKGVIKFSVWTTLIALTQRLIFNVSPSIIAAFSGSTQISIFAIASTLEGYTWTVATALSGLFLAKVTRLLKQEDNEKKILALMIKIGRIQLFIVGLIIIGFTLVGQEFILSWVGPDFQEAYLITLLIIIMQIISITQDIAKTSLVAKGDIKYRAIGTLIMGTISLLGSLLLAKSLGALGVGISIFFGQLIGNVIYMNYVYAKKININLGSFFGQVHLRFIPTTIITLVLGFMSIYYIPTGRWLWLFVKIIIVILIFVLSAWLTFLNKEEKTLFVSIIKRIIGKIFNGRKKDNSDV